MIRRKRKRISKPPRRRSKTIGSLGRVTSYGPSRSAVIIVGLNKGNAPQNQGGRCKQMTPEIDPERADKVFIRNREKQVGRKNVGATRRVGRGWYEGAPERSISYEVIYTGAGDEDSFRRFSSRMKKLGEQMAKQLCQDEVIVVVDDADKREAFAASCPTPKSCKRIK